MKMFVACINTLSAKEWMAIFLLFIVWSTIVGFIAYSIGLDVRRLRGLQSRINTSKVTVKMDGYGRIHLDEQGE